jgi:hypothetical protein
VCINSRACSARALPQTRDIFQVGREEAGRKCVTLVDRPETCGNCRRADQNLECGGSPPPLRSTISLPLHCVAQNSKYAFRRFCGVSLGGKLFLRRLDVLPPRHSGVSIGASVFASYQQQTKPRNVGKRQLLAQGVRSVTALSICERPNRSNWAMSYVAKAEQPSALENFGRRADNFHSSSSTGHSPQRGRAVSTAIRKAPFFASTDEDSTAHTVFLHSFLYAVIAPTPLRMVSTTVLHARSFCAGCGVYLRAPASRLARRHCACLPAKRKPSS